LTGLILKSPLPFPKKIPNAEYPSSTGQTFWFCAFSIFNPETRTSRRVFRSTKMRDKEQAKEICRAWHKAALKARNGKLSVT
jgi:hypothetical protein